MKKLFDSMQRKEGRKEKWRKGEREGERIKKRNSGKLKTTSEIRGRNNGSENNKNILEVTEK